MHTAEVGDRAVTGKVTGAVGGRVLGQNLTECNLPVTSHSQALLKIKFYLLVLKSFSTSKFSREVSLIRHMSRTHYPVF